MKRSLVLWMPFVLCAACSLGGGGEATQGGPFVNPETDTTGNPTTTATGDAGNITTTGNTPGDAATTTTTGNTPGDAGNTTTTGNTPGNAATTVTGPTDGGTEVEADSSPETGPMADCTPVKWGNPGKVVDPEVEPVASDAGKGVPFGHALGLEDHGYEEHEFFFSASSPDFKSRFLVERPSDPSKFSGTVYVEWYNVSGTMDVPVMWSAAQEYFMRAGHVYIGVSAQSAGVDALVNNVDADRYEGLHHPGDGDANQIYSMAGTAVRLHPDMILGDCMYPKAVIGVGQSQSSMKLVDYLNQAAGSDKVYDAIMTHSGGTPPTNPPVPNFVIRTMNEGNANSNGPKTVEWDVAAASHNDKRLTEKSFEIIGKAYGFDKIPFTCENPMNDYPAYRAYSAALDWMSRWVRNGEKPPASDPFEMDPAGGYALDDVGNMKGGVRLPDIDVPIKIYKQDNGPAGGDDLFGTAIGFLACGLAGTANPLPPEKLKELYPTHDDYVQKYTAATKDAVMKGFLLQADADQMIEIAEMAPVPE